MRHRSAWLLTGALLTLLAGRAQASVTAALSLEELVHRADDVFVAEAIATNVHRDALGRIATDVTLRIAEPMRSERVQGEEVVLRTLGGSIDGVGMRVEGETTLAVGERALVFARRADGGWLRTVGMSQGLMPVVATDGAWFVLPGGAGLELLRRGPGGRLVPGAPALDGPTPLDELRADIAAVGGR